MSYKLYVTYICCTILNSIQIHYNPSRTYIYIQQSIVFGQLLLRIHYLMAPPGLDPVEGSQTFTSFLVRLLVDLGLLQARGRRCALFEMYACVNVCVCVYSPACIGCLPLFSSWVKHFLRISSDSLLSADCVQLDSGLPHFEAGVGVTADFPVNWSQYQRPWRVNEDSQSLKAPSWRRSPSYDDCHLKVVRAEATNSPPGRICALCLPCQPHRRWILPLTQS